MSQVTVSPAAGLSNARGNTPELTLVAQSAPGATPLAQQRLQTLPNGEGEVAVRDEYGNTVATTLKARQVLRDGQWRSEGFVAERMSAYSAVAPHGNARPEPNGYGYFRAEHGKMRVITGRDGRVITDLARARVRTGELIRHGETGRDVVCAAFRQDGLELVVGLLDGSLHFWDPKEAQVCSKTSYSLCVLKLFFQHLGNIDGRQVSVSLS